jgi:plasmid stabilization system protein ParE
LEALRRSMRIRYSPRATRDLDSIREFLAQRSPRGAVNVMAAMFVSTEFIRRNPEAAEITRIAGVRGKFVRRYRFKIFYRVLGNQDVVEIVHVRHTSQRPWLGGDD